MSLLLPLILLLPLLGAIAIAIALLPDAAKAKWLALGVSVLVAVLSVVLALGFDWRQDLEKSAAPERLDRSVQVQWPAADPQTGVPADFPLELSSIGFRLHLGVDSISLWLVLLTVLLTPLALAASFSSIREREKEYYAWMLVLLTAMVGVFVARDLLLFYIFFELTLIPMFFIIGIWGGPERRYAAIKFFLFTFAGSVFTLAGVIYLGLMARTFDISTVIRIAQSGNMPETAKFLVMLAFLAGFAVKVPLFPVHTWLPLAHTEAPTAGSVILAGVLLKLGTYGLLRLVVPIGLLSAGATAGADGVVFPTTVKVLGVLCVVGVIYGALVAWVQRDIKKLVAYSSVSHLGFCVLGLLALNAIGIQGSILYMINHGLSTGALFLVIGMIYDRFHTRDIDELSGLGRQMPKLAFFFGLFTMSSIGLPGTNGFISEFLSILGAFTSDHLGIGFGALAALGVILGAVYMLHMVARVIFGPLKYPGYVAGGHTAHGHAHGQEDAGQGATPGHDDHGHGHGHGHGHVDASDINGREIAVLVPIAVLVIVLGVMPAPVMRSMAEEIELIRTPLAVAPGEIGSDAQAPIIDGQPFRGGDAAPEERPAPQRPAPQRAAPAREPQ